MKQNQFQQGDIISVEFSPTVGHEQKGRRPGLIVSNDTYNQINGLYLVCPISSNMKNFPTHVELKGTEKIHGKIYCEHVRALDLHARNAKKIEDCPTNILEEAKEIIKLFLSK